MQRVSRIQRYRMLYRLWRAKRKYVRQLEEEKKAA